MHELPTEWTALAAIVFLLGLKHGFDADHLATIDGLTRFNARSQQRWARLCGVLFSLGHGAVVMVIALAVGYASERWTPPEWLDLSGTLISLGFLTLLGVINLRAVLAAAPGEVVAPVGFKGRYLGQLNRAGRPWMVALVGALFALSFDTVSQAALFAVTATHFGGVGSGEALKSYQALQDIARQNGFKLQDILPRISTATTGGNLDNAVLQKLSTGELDVNAIAQNARMLAAAGQPQYVRDLLNQGYDLSAIYAPYRTAMAGVLELNPDQIDLNDPTLRAGITDKGDMNLYDYRKLLKQDNRWQYTANAAQEVSDSALRVLRDFGMMG